MTRPAESNPLPLSTGCLFEDLGRAEDEEGLETLLERPGLRVERIVSHGHASPEGFWYDQSWPEWVVVLRGRAGLELEGRSGVLEMGPGDWVILPAHRRHRVAWTTDDEPTVWLAVHFEEAAEAVGDGARVVRRRPQG